MNSQTIARPEPRLEVRDLRWRQLWAGARLLGQAYEDGALWAAAGSLPRWQRRSALTALYLAELVIAQLMSSGITLAAYRADRLDGILVLYGDERTTPWWGWALRSVACLLAGPRAVVHAVRISNALDRMRPSRPHVWFAVLGRRVDSVGVGYVLIRAGQARADALGLPGYLETSAGPEQVQINEMLGWTSVDEYVLSTGSVIKTMWRDRTAPS
ncbi:hypothetical protein AB0B71_15635 [Micromonospora echinofusca]|uniref:hypothetical protein n=1 Tax=Micromonospora echinofusca TaxID=47858 RepID=UPI0033C594FA